MSFVQKNILLVEDTPSLSRVYIDYLKQGGYEVVLAECGAVALDYFQTKPFDAVLLDLKLPDINGMDVLKKMILKKLSCPIIIITAHGSVSNAVEAMQLGAKDFLSKPFHADRLLVTLKNVLDANHLKSVVDEYEKTSRHHYRGFIGSSLLMQSVYRIIENVATSKASVFITGESGTGKEVCAEAIHAESPRAGKPFVALNCGAIPKDLMESEIFGHVKGAFTGALNERDGAATQADGGTLFLDEICEMDMALQTKLLRFLQTGTFQKVGSNIVEHTNIRVVAATNQNPLRAVEKGTFREDLYYRLHVIPIHLPPLRERGHDIIEIASAFLENMAAEERKKFVNYNDAVLDVLLSYEWPGNVRELQNIIRNIVVLHDGEQVTQDMLPPPLDKVSRSSSVVVPSASVSFHETDNQVFTETHRLPTSEQDIRPLAESEKDIIEEAIALCDGNIPKAAALLDVSPSTIYRKKAGWDKE